MSRVHFVKRVHAGVACVVGTASILLIAGCRSPEPTFITLQPLPPASEFVKTASTPIAVGEVTLPTEVDRKSLVFRHESNRLEIDPTARWGAPFDELVRETLWENLNDRLPAGDVLAPSRTLDTIDADVLTVVFETFSADARGDVHLDATWRLLDPAGETLLVRNVSLKTSAGSDTPSEIARAMSEALRHFTDRIAQALRSASPRSPEE